MSDSDEQEPEPSQRDAEARKEVEQIKRLPKQIRHHMWEIAAATRQCGPELDRYVDALPPAYRDAAHRWSGKLTVLRNVLGEMAAEEERLRIRRGESDPGSVPPGPGRS